MRLSYKSLLIEEKEFQVKQNEIVKKYRDIFKKLNTGKKEQQKDTVNMKSCTSELDKIPRTSILMNINQMVREDYPTPFDESGNYLFMFVFFFFN